MPDAPSPPSRIRRPDVLRIAAESCRDPKTVERVLSGKGNATEQSKAAVLDAAKRLGIALPEA